MSKTNQELFERAIQIINQDIEIYQKLNTTQFDKGLDLFEIYSECYDINFVANNNIQRIITYIDSESINNYENENEFEKNDALIQLQFLLKQLQNQQSSDIAVKNIFFKNQLTKIVLSNIKVSKKIHKLKKIQIKKTTIKQQTDSLIICTKYQKIIAITNELISFLEKHSDLYKQFKIQSDQLIYLRICDQDPVKSLILKSGLQLLTEWLVVMLYKFKILKNIEFETKSQARLQYQANVMIQFVLNQKESIEKNKKECQQKIMETLLTEQQVMAEILAEGFALSKLTEYLVGQFQGGFCGIGEWVKRVIQVANLNGLLNTQDNIKK